MTKIYPSHERAKHIDMQHHFIKEKIKIEEFLLVYISSKINVADLPTKSLSKNIMRNFTMDLGLYKSKEAWGQEKPIE